MTAVLRLTDGKTTSTKPELSSLQRYFRKETDFTELRRLGVIPALHKLTDRLHAVTTYYYSDMAKRDRVAMAQAIVLLTAEINTRAMEALR